MPKFPVSPAKEKDLLDKMQKYGIKEGEIEEKFIRGSGPGGQKIHKTSSCVYIHHLPSGIEVKCQLTRSQALNRYHARKLLVQEMETRIEGKMSAEEQKREKIRRQKRRRSRRAKQKMLDNKKKQSQQKQQRSKPSPNND